MVSKKLTTTLNHIHQSLQLNDDEEKYAVKKLTDNSMTALDRNNSLEDMCESTTGVKPIYNKQYDLMSYNSGPDTVPIENLEKAMKAVMISLQPLPTPIIEQRLKDMLLLITLSKDADPKLITAKIKALARKINENFPADITLEGIQTVERQCRFFPSFAEFCEHMDWKLKPRKLLYEALHKCIANRIKTC